MIATSKGPIPIHEALGHAVVVLPSRIQGETGIYSGATAQLVKGLRAVGVDASYLHDADHRQWHVLMGDVPTELIIAIAGSAAWALIQTALGKMLGGSRDVQARVLRQRRGSDGTLDNTWFEYEGPVDGFLAALPHIDSPEGQGDG